MIVQELYKIQAKHGYLPRAELESMADRLALPLYRIQEVVSFFPHYRTTPPPKCEILVCRDMACELRGSGQLFRDLKDECAQPSSDAIQVRQVSCMGRCDRAPAVRCNFNEPSNALHAHHESRLLLGRNPEEIKKIIGSSVLEANAKALPHDSDAAYLPFDVEQWRINVYSKQAKEAQYESIRRFITACATDEGRAVAQKNILAALEVAGLLGMGGAGGRTYKKWSEVLQAVGDKKYVVCNGDESEPGTFKDREILLRCPNLVLEGVILAGLFLHAERGYIYIRHEYEEQIEAMEREIEFARKMGLCGENVLGSQQSFHVEVFVSPGGYICGEQTALVEAIEDKRAEPRNRPPELQTNGIGDMPTLLNNVETFAWVPSIILREGSWYKSQGSKPEFSGARFFSVSGDVVRPGVHEVPIGITLKKLIEICGGMRDGQALKAVALSGPSGGFLPAKLPLAMIPAELKKDLPPGASDFDLQDLELDVGLVRKWKLMLGAGIVIYGDEANMVDQAVASLDFYRSESCGKCVPCRIGSTKMWEISQNLQTGQYGTAELEQLKSRSGVVSELADTMRQTAICGLGNIASNPLVTLLAHFEDEYKPYLKSPR